MAKIVTVFRGTSGVNNKLDPTRISIDFKTGICALAEGVNINIDDTGRIDRCRGFTATSITDAMHSLFDCGSYALGVSGDALQVINPNYSVSSIRNVTENARMRYVKFNDVIFYLNGYEKGYVQNKVSYAWTRSTYTGPTTDRTYSDPPIGYILEIYKGRMLIAVRKSNAYFIKFSEAGYLGRFDMALNGMPFQSHIRMVRSVQNGFYVSTDDAIYWISGPISIWEGGLQFPPIMQVADYPSVEGTDLIVPGSRIGDGIPGEIAIWTAGQGKGICIGTMDGRFQNLTEGELTYPDAHYGTALYKDGKYIVSLQA